MTDVFTDSDGTYGYQRIQACLERRGVRVDAGTIRSVMLQQRLQAAQPRARVRTTVPAEDLDERKGLLGRDFTTEEPEDKAVRRHHLYPYLGGFHLPGDRPGLLHQETGGLGHGGSHAHITGA